MEQNTILTQEEFENALRELVKGGLFETHPHLSNLLADRAALLSLVQRQRSLLKMEKCPNCDGSGAIQGRTYRPATFVSRDMATDAGMPELEGSIYQDESEDFDCEPCQWCDERKQVLASFPTELKPTQRYARIK